VGRPQYEHTQAGWPLRIALVLGALLFVAMTALEELRQSPTSLALLIGGAVLAATLGWLFSSLTVRVQDGALRLHFGLGVPRKSWPLAEVESVDVTRTRFWDGWGVHRTRRGWLYNVSGFDAVLVRLAGGKAVLVGTDEPRKLKAAIERALTAATRRRQG
jgi:hypothetical protein